MTGPDTTPDYVGDILNAFLTGLPLNFGHHAVPAAVRERLEQAYRDGTLRGVAEGQDFEAMTRPIVYVQPLPDDATDTAVHGRPHRDAPDPDDLIEPMTEAALGRLADNITAKLDAGACLFYAIYHHPHAKDMFGVGGGSHGFTAAYTAASKAWLR